MAAHPARPGLQVRAGERRGHDPRRPADQHPCRPAAAARQCIFLPTTGGEVARRAGGVMNNMTDAHDPSARFAGTSPSKTIGRYLSLDQQRALGAKSDLVGALLVLHAWALIAGGMALFVWWPNPFTFLLGVMVIGGRRSASPS